MTSYLYRLLDIYYINIIRICSQKTNKNFQIMGFIRKYFLKKEQYDVPHQNLLKFFQNDNRDRPIEAEHIKN